MDDRFRNFDFRLKRSEKLFLIISFAINANRSNSSTSHSIEDQRKKVFGFQIYVNNDILDLFQNYFFEKIKKHTGISKIGYNPELTIPDLRGKNIQIYDQQMSKKYQAAKYLLEQVYNKQKLTHKSQKFSALIFVPQGMVSLLIGTKGHQINKIMKESSTIIVVNQPINRMTYRTVKITGHHADAARACRKIYQILEQKSSIAYTIEKEPNLLDYSKAKVKVHLIYKTKFIFTQNLVQWLTTKKKNFLKRIQEESKTAIKFKEDKKNKLLKRDQQLSILIGRLQDVQNCLVILLSKIQIFFDNQKQTDYTLKMLIPSNYVTKLIGQKGYMIRDIIQRSGGSQIKILSDKQSQRDSKQCIISINGTKGNKIDSSCLILEQIQCFKNGGPVTIFYQILQSGKSINQNLAQQYKNSLPLRTDGNQESENNFQEDYDKQIGEVSRDSVEQKQQKIFQFRQKSKVQSFNQKHKYKKKKQRSRSRDISVSKQKQKQKIETKLLLPKILASDFPQLNYISSISKGDIVLLDQVRNIDQRMQGNQAVVILRGSIEQNTNSFRLLQKRLHRITHKQRQ